MELRAGESGGGCFACRALVRVQTPLTDHGSGFLFGCRCLSQLLHSTSFVLGRWIFINEFLDSKTPIQPQFYVGRVHAPKPRAGFSGTAVCGGEEGRGWVLFFFVGEFGTWAYAARRTGSEVGAVWRHGGERYVPYSGLTRVIRITSELLRLGSNAGITATS